MTFVAHGLAVVALSLTLLLIVLALGLPVLALVLAGGLLLTSAEGSEVFEVLAAPSPSSGSLLLNSPTLLSFSVK